MVLGTVFLGLGALGLVLPVLPTTPFVLLAGACYVRASARLHQRLRAQPHVRADDRGLEQLGAIPSRAKAIAIAMVILTFGSSIALRWSRRSCARPSPPSASSS